MARHLPLMFRVATIPLLIACISWSEAWRPTGYFRLLSLIFAFLLLIDFVVLLRGRWRDGAIVIASLVLGLCLVEGLGMILEPKQLIVRSQGLYERQPVIGFGPSHPGKYHDEKSDPKTGATIFNAEYTIDAHLLRQIESGDRGPTIVFFGDSMTFGVGVNDADTLPQIFSDLLDRKQRVLNVAFGGHGPQHFLRELETGFYDPLIGARARLFIFMTAAWHAERSTCRPFWMRYAPRYDLEGDGVAFKGECEEGAQLRLREWIENSAAYRYFIEPQSQKLSHDDVELYIRTLVAAVGLAKEKYGVRTLIPYIPVTADYLHRTGFTDAMIVERLRQGGAIVLDVSLEKEEAEGALMRIPGDGHPTPLANRLRALILKAYLEQHTSGILVSGLE